MFQPDFQAQHIWILYICKSEFLDWSIIIIIKIGVHNFPIKLFYECSIFFNYLCQLLCSLFTECLYLFSYLFIYPRWQSYFYISAILNLFILSLGWSHSASCCQLCFPACMCARAGKFSILGWSYWLLARAVKGHSGFLLTNSINRLSLKINRTWFSQSEVIAAPAFWECWRMTLDATPWTAD